MIKTAVRQKKRARGAKFVIIAAACALLALLAFLVLREILPPGNSTALRDYLFDNSAVEINQDNTGDWSQSREGSFSYGLSSPIEVKKGLAALSFQNPPENTCYLQIQLERDDGQGWEASGFLKPGQELPSIQLPSEPGSQLSGTVQAEAIITALEIDTLELREEMRLPVTLIF